MDNWKEAASDGIVVGVNSDSGAGSEDQGSVFIEKLLLKYKQAACYLSVSEPYLRRLKAQGKIPFVELGSGKRRGVRFSVKSLDRWVETREIR